MPMTWFGEYLNANTPCAVWNKTEDFAIRICMELKQHQQLAENVMRGADELIRRGSCPPEAGKALFFALEQTGDDKYRQEIKAVMASLQDANAGPDSLAALYDVLPFRMAYEMRLNGMEKVGQVVGTFKTEHQRRWDGKQHLHRSGDGFCMRDEAWFLLALADCIMLCSDQLYEHWRALVDIYRETLSGVVRLQTADGLLPGCLEGDADAIATAVVDYAMLMGVRRGIIDPERYLPIVRKHLAALKNTPQVRAAEMMEEVFGVK